MWKLWKQLQFTMAQWPTMLMGGVGYGRFGDRMNQQTSNQQTNHFSYHVSKKITLLLGDKKKHVSTNSFPRCCSRENLGCFSKCLPEVTTVGHFGRISPNSTFYLVGYNKQF